MTDPRLNSVHLPSPRREDFRHAREVLLDARGYPTLEVELGSAESDHTSNNTLIQKSPLSHPSKRLHCWLADDQYVYPLKVGINTIGRSQDNDIVLPENHISRRHCAILVHLEKACELHDTASRNGVTLNGDKLTHPMPLKAGDAIRLCDHRFVFVVRDEQPSDQMDGTVAL